MCNACGDDRHVPAPSRRAFLVTGALAAVAPWVTGRALAADPPAPGSAPPPNAISPSEALRRLLEGNARYAANTPNQRDYSAGRAARAQAQYPIAAILSCADSRVSPELLFDQNPGDLFVVRVAGNVVSPDLLASIEYGVHFLGVPLVLVLGHSNCGAVDAALKVLKNQTTLPGHLPELITAIKPAAIIAERTGTGNLLDNAIAENVRRQAGRLKESPPIVKKLYGEKKIDIAGGVYDIATGRVAMV
jgi:carbonic anhydrase